MTRFLILITLAFATLIPTFTFGQEAAERVGSVDVSRRRHAGPDYVQGRTDVARMEGQSSYEQAMVTVKNAEAQRYIAVADANARLHLVEKIEFCIDQVPTEAIQAQCQPLMDLLGVHTLTQQGVGAGNSTYLAWNAYMQNATNYQMAYQANQKADANAAAIRDLTVFTTDSVGRLYANDRALDARVGRVESGLGSLNAQVADVRVDLTEVADRARMGHQWSTALQEATAEELARQGELLEVQQAELAQLRANAVDCEKTESNKCED